MILVFLVIFATLLVPFILLYGYLCVRHPDRMKSAGSVRFGLIAGPLLSMSSAMGSIVLVTRVPSIWTPLGTVNPVALVDASTFGILLGTIVGVWSIVSILRA